MTAKELPIKYRTSVDGTYVAATLRFFVGPSVHDTMQVSVGCKGSIDDPELLAELRNGLADCVAASIRSGRWAEPEDEG